MLVRIVAVVTIAYGAFALNVDGAGLAAPAWLAGPIFGADDTPASAMLFIVLGVVLFLLTFWVRDRDAA